MANCTKKQAGAVLGKIESSAGRQGLTLLTDKESGRFMPSAKVLDTVELLASVDAVMALGGDGTMLRTVRALGGNDVPVIGVNIGGLGFLTSVAESEIDDAMARLAADEYTVSVRSIAESVVLRAGREQASFRALNEIVLSSISPRIVELALSVDGDQVAIYSCDGVIVSTPTGSTGHSLSNGGPILLPEIQAFVISLICPHSLSSRPLVVHDTASIEIQVVDGSVLCTADGQVGQALERGDVVRVRRSGLGVRFIHLPGYSYFDVLRRKLHWSGSSRQI